ncbi:AAA family ATPase [Sulfurihydrogenibium subterraneum]|uniref:AAA family ATPase n=1 Tax=Sulfurihydrogenibium subterraneum TaxID=171121 RepID=UPI00048DCA50|nr:AAA family ATPase [Sulfurihydrogenibium subterraneum]
MILTRLTLKNFLAHENTQIEFSQSGITAIIGENGSGKTSILEGIMFALFGRSSKGNQADLIKWGRSKAVVELEFIKNGITYKIVRELDKKGKNVSSTSLLYKVENGRTILERQKNLKQELPKITGISEKTFLNSVLIRQGEIEGFIKQKPSDREKTIEEILDLHLYAKLLEKYADKRKNYEKQLDILKSEKIDKQAITDQIQVITDQINQLETILNQLNHQKQNLDQELKQIEDKIILYNQLENEKKLIQANLNNINQKIQEINKKLVEIQNIKQQLPELQKKVIQLQDLEELYNKLQKLENLYIRLSQIEKDLEEIQQKIDFKQKFQPIYQQIIEKQQNLIQLSQEIIKLENIKGEIGQIEKLITEKQKDLQIKKQKYDQIVKQLLQYYSKFQQLFLNPHMVNEHINQNKFKIEYLTNELDIIKQEKTSIEAEGKQLKERLSNLSSIQGDCPTCGRPLEEHQKQELINEINKVLEEKRVKHKQLSQKQKEIEEELKKQKEIEQLLNQLKPIYDSIKEVENEISTYTAKLKAKQHQIKDLDQLKLQKDEIEKFISAHTQDFGYYQKILQENLKEIKTNLIEEKNTILKDIENIGLKVEPVQIKQEISQISQQIQQLKPYKDRYNQLLPKINEEDILKNQLQESENTKNQLEKQLQETKNKLQNLDIKTIQEEREKIKTQIEEKNKEISEKNQQFGHLQGQKSILEDTLKKAQEQEEKITQISEKVKKYYKVENAIDQIQKLLKENAIYNLPKITEEIFNRFGFNQFINLKFSEKYDIVLTANAVSSSNVEVNIDALSGGQRVALSIALRLAIAKLLNEKADFLILDEPTIFLDDERKKELVDLFGELKENNFIKQLIITTHDEELEGWANVIYKVKDGSVELIS